MQMFQNGMIRDVVVKDLVKHIDERGWLTELFRSDEIADEHAPVMAYVSFTLPDIARGPHEHVRQTDYFAFLGPSNFKLYLWDNRKDSPTYLVRHIVYAGADAPRTVIIPPGIVHAYRNLGGKPGMVINCPNALFGGKGKREPVDEVRHENDSQTIFRLD
jgi:dTDP-4-dehydrorhamnose 3,5-epimerase